MANLRSPLLPLLAALALTLATTVATTIAEAEHLALGRVEPADLEDEEVQKAIDFAVKTYNDMNNDVYLSRPTRVMSASQQVVAGMNYFFKIEFSQTTCTKTQTDLSDCPFKEQPDQKKVICNFQINTIPWLNKISTINFNCPRA